MNCTNVLKLFELLSKDMLKLDELDLVLMKRELHKKIKILKKRYEALNGIEEGFQSDFAALRDVESKGLPFEGLVPLTNRVFVPGRVEEVELLHHAGESYFISKSLPQAVKTVEERWRNLQKDLNRNELVTILMESIWSFACQILFIRRRMEVDQASDEKKAEVEEKLFKMYQDTIAIFNGNAPDKFFDSI